MYLQMYINPQTHRCNCGRPNHFREAFSSLEAAAQLVPEAPFGRTFPVSSWRGNPPEKILQFQPGSISERQDFPGHV